LREHEGGEHVSEFPVATMKVCPVCDKRFMGPYATCSLRCKIRLDKSSRAEARDELSSLFARADAAGKQAAATVQVRPMVVQQHASPIDDSSPVVQQWVVDDGVCGFAWVVITPGNCTAARYAKEHWGASKHYYGGVSIWISDYNQSMTRKEAYARAFAKVLQEAGIKAYAGSRLD
jgi:hypothetical protein